MAETAITTLWPWKEEIQKKTGYIAMQKDGTFDVDANTSIYQLSEELDVKIPKGHQYETSEVSSVRHLAIYQKKLQRWSCYLKGQIKKRIMNIPTQNLTTMMRRKSIKCLDLSMYMQILEANERKVGKVRFKPINNGSPDLESRGLNRLLSTKAVKRKKHKEIEPDSNNTMAEREEEDRYSDELSYHERLEDGNFYATIEKGRPQSKT